MSDVASPPGASCPECVHWRTLLEAALQRIAELEAEVRDLRGQLTRNSSNSSTPPSADPPGAPKPVVKRPTGRQPGGPGLTHQISWGFEPVHSIESRSSTPP